MSGKVDDRGPRFWPALGNPEMAAAQDKLRDERNRAEADMAYRFANLAMPEDIRSRAKSWGLEAFAEVLWNSAFQAGYREAMRDRSESSQ